MAGVQLTAKDTTPVSGWNESSQRFHNINQAHDLRVCSSAAPSLRSCAGIRFPVTPTDFDELRQVFMNITMDNDAYDDLHCIVKGHKVANSGPFIPGSLTEGPRVRYETQGTVSQFIIAADGLAPLPYEIPASEGLENIFNEIMGVPGWVPGNAITLLFYGFSDREKEARIYPSYFGGAEQAQPYVFASYGPIGSDPVVTDLLIMGDSWGAYPGHSGFTKGGITFPLFPNCTFYDAAAGMGGTVGSADIYGGDNIRGYTPLGIIQEELEARYGDTDLLITKHQCAFAGSTTTQWLPGGIFWGDVNTAGSTLHRLANPRSFTSQQIVYLSLGGNDVINNGKAVRVVWEEDMDAAEAWWKNLADTITDDWLDTIIQHIFEHSEDETKCWIVLPGYSPFCVIGQDEFAANTVVFANSMSHDLFRNVWCIDGYSMCGRQFYWDSIHGPAAGGSHHPGGLAQQCTLTQFATKWQKGAHPETIAPGQEWNPNSDWFQYAQWQVNFPWPLGPLAYAAWSYGGENGWRKSFRNCTDITVNRMMMLLDAGYRRLDGKYERVIYTPSWDKMPVDTVLSKDPASPYAQSSRVYWVEGIHFNENGYRQWLTAPGSVLDQIDERVEFMPGFQTPPPGDPGEEPEPEVPTEAVVRTTSYWKFLVGPGNVDAKLISNAISRNMRFELKGTDSVDLTLNIESPENFHIAELETDLKIYHRGSKVFRGTFGPSTDTLDEQSGKSQYAIVDYRGRLERSLIYDDDNAYWFGEDISVIVNDLLSFVQNRVNGNMGITTGYGFPALGRIREEMEIAPGENVYSAIQKMAESKEFGFDWEIDGNLQLNLYPKRGTLVPKNLEYRGTIKGLTRNYNTGEFANAGRLSGGDTVLPEILEAVTLSADARGRWDAALTWPDVETQDLLADRGMYLLEQVNRVPVVYNVSLRQGWWGGPTHLWLGDMVALRIKMGRLNVTEILRIHAIDITLDEHGGEEVSMELK